MTDETKKKSVKFPDMKSLPVVQRMRAGLQATKDRHAKRLAARNAVQKTSA